MESACEENPFQALRARSLLLWGLISIPLCILALLLVGALTGLNLGNPTSAFIASGVWWHGLILIWAFRNFRKLHISAGRLIGAFPEGLRWLRTVAVLLPLMLFSIGSFHLVYYLVSLLAPSYVRQILSERLLLSASETPAPMLHNTIVLFFGVVVAPCTEEFLFRGILLHRWSVKWGVKWGVLISSLVFALGHDDIIGKFAVGFVMAVLYVKTRTLLVPIVCHMLNNAVALGMSMATLGVHGTTDSLRQFQSDFWFGAVCFILSAPWVLYFIWKNWPGQSWVTPYFARVNPVASVEAGLPLPVRPSRSFRLPTEYSQSMKEVVSVSLGSSTRDHEARVSLLGEEFHLSRRGTDGDLRKAIELLKSLDGHVDAIGLGGLDIYLVAAGKKYPLRDGLRLKEAVKQTPVVDGSGLKNTLEREVIRGLHDRTYSFTGKKVLMVSALDRFGMAETLWELGAEMVCGDFIFALGLDKPITSLEELAHYAEKLLPELGKLPISFLYPIGKEQEKCGGAASASASRDASSSASAAATKYASYYHDADVIAGDFHFIRKYIPATLEGKVVITNTVTERDVRDLEERKVKLLVTTTPEFQGRSFGTNLLEAMLLAILKKAWEEVSAEEYLDLIRKLNLKPRIHQFQG